MATKIHVKQVRSTIGRTQHQRKVMAGLGLRGIGKEVVLMDTPAIRGLVLKVQHLVEVRVLEGEAPVFGRRAK